MTQVTAPMPSAGGRRQRGAGVLRLFLCLIAALGLTTLACLRLVPEGHTGVVTRWGRPVRVVAQPGTYWQWPAPIDRLQLLDLRRQLADVPAATVFTRDKKSLIIEAYVVWRVFDPLLFLQAAGDSQLAEAQLNGLATSAVNQELSRRDLAALASVDAGTEQLAAVERRLRELLDDQVRTRLGVAIDEFGLLRVTLPEENRAAVLERMRAERQAEAGRIRSEGAKAAQAIRDDAHVRSQEILRRGREEAARITAEAEQLALEQLADAQQRDPELYRLWSSLEASRRAIGKQSVLILRSDRGFLDALLPAGPMPRVEPWRMTGQQQAGDRPGTDSGESRGTQ
ncbi:MAG: protease modulator HflC [Pirellulales bacterium]